VSPCSFSQVGFSTVAHRPGLAILIAPSGSGTSFPAKIYLAYGKIKASNY